MTVVTGNDWAVLVPPAGATWRPTRKVSICVPAHQPADISRLLDAVALQSYPQHLIEVVIGDDGSTPEVSGSFDPADYGFEVTVVRLERTSAFGAGRARNAAAAAAEGDVLVFLDADMIPEAHVVACYVRWFIDRSDVFVTGLCNFADMNGLTRGDLRRHLSAGTMRAAFSGQHVDDQGWREITFERTSDLRRDTSDAFRVVVGATFALTAEQYAEVGGFRELGVRGIEDTEFGYRVHANGAVMVLDRDAVHWHQGRRTIGVERSPSILADRQPYVERLLPVFGFREGPPRTTPIPVGTVPRVVVHAVEDSDVAQPVQGQDQLLVGPAGIPAGCIELPFLPAYCHVVVPSGACIGPDTPDRLARELSIRNVGAVRVPGPDGREVVAVRTRAWRRIVREHGRTDLLDRPSEVASFLPEITRSFGSWFVSDSVFGVRWVGEPDRSEPLTGGGTVDVRPRRTFWSAIEAVAERVLKWMAR